MSVDATLTQDHLDKYLELVNKLLRLDRKTVAKINRVKKKIALYETFSRYATYINYHLKQIKELDSVKNKNHKQVFKAYTKHLQDVELSSSLISKEIMKEEAIEKKGQIETDIAYRLTIKGASIVVKDLLKFKKMISSFDSYFHESKKNQSPFENHQKNEKEKKTQLLSKLKITLEDIKSSQGIESTQHHIDQLLLLLKRKLDNQKRVVKLIYEQLIVLKEKSTSMSKNPENFNELLKDSTSIYRSFKIHTDTLRVLFFEEKKQITDPLYNYVKHLQDVFDHIYDRKKELYRVENFYGEVFRNRNIQLTAKREFDIDLKVGKLISKSDLFRLKAQMNDPEEYNDLINRLARYKFLLDNQLKRYIYAETKDGWFLPSADTWRDKLKFFAQNLSWKKLSELRRLKVDPLTGLYLRRDENKFFYEMFDAYLSSKRNKTFSAILFDLDDFKGCNSINGYSGGDKILLECVRVTNDSFRTNSKIRKKLADVVFRHGGEEFIIIMPDTTLQEATIVAERFRKKLEKESINFMQGINKKTFGEEDQDLFAKQIYKDSEIPEAVTHKIIYFCQHKLGEKPDYNGFLPPRFAFDKLLKKDKSLKKFDALKAFLSSTDGPVGYTPDSIHRGKHEKKQAINKIIKFALRKRRVTASIGVVGFPEDLKLPQKMEGKQKKYYDKAIDTILTLLEDTQVASKNKEGNAVSTTKDLK